MGERMRRFDWTDSAVGTPDRWPQSLRTIVRMMLDSRYAMWMLWGPELTFFCNDAYLPTVGFKRAWVLGARADKVWEEIWPDIGPRIRQVLEQGQSTWDEALLLFLERRGFLEETYHTFSYSPVYDDTPSIAGMLCVVTEVTDKLLVERRLNTLRELGAVSGLERSASAQEACRVAVATLARNGRDIPWIAALLVEEQQHARLRAISGADGAALGLHEPQRLQEGFPSRWHLEEVIRTQRSVLIEGLEPLHIAAGPWMQPVVRACAVPVLAPGHDGVAAILIVGLSPRLAFDGAYQEFLEQCTLYLGQALTNARAYEEERRRVAALAELDQAKTRFFSNVSHEFRTPLTLMLGPIEDALKEPGTPPPLLARLDLAHRNSLRLLKLVNSLLDFSRLEAGRLQATFEPTDLAATTRAIASSFESAIGRAGLTYRVECESLDELVFVDRDLWEKIVLNLISNAFKFTLAGGITVRLRREEGHALLEVLDSGVGIPEIERSHIFERFYRTESTRGRTFEGSGIGLAFVQELVRLHGGRVGFESTVGQGTTFFVRLPFGSHHLPVERVRTSVKHVEPPSLARAFVQEALRWLPEGAPLEGAPSEPIEAGRADRRFERTFGAHILIADDNLDMRSYLRELLSGSYVVEAVGDGEAALEAARRRPPDLILSDVMMPRLGGLGLLRAVRSDERLRRVPVVLLSARAGEEAHIEGLDAGADDYLIKPFSARELLARLGALLELKQMREAGEQRLRIALAAARMVTWDWDLKSNRVQFSANAAEVLGAEWTDRSYVRSIIHPDDWSAHQKEIREAIRTRGSLRSEVRMRRPDTGELRWFEVRGQVECDASGDARAINGVTLDVTERKRVEEALRDMDRRKDEFLAMLAHELRNPLAPIQTGSELLERNYADEPIHGIATMVKRQVAQLARLVDDLLDVSRITQGRIELKREPIELSEVVQRSLETVMPLLHEKEHRLENVPSITPLYVRGDIARLVQSLANLLANAAKYTDRRGEIRVEVRRDRGFGVIEVRDDGIGIHEELLPHVFELFVQGERGLDRSHGGLGIGLSVVKRLVEMHGGTVSAASGGEKQGSTFTIRLPLIAEPLRGEARRTAPAGAGAAPPEPRRVLVIDDNVDAADTLCMLLKVAGHAAEAVYGAHEALERLSDFNAEAALVDIGLPDMNGYDLARQIRARSGRIQLIALTGYGQQEDFARSREAGFDAHMIKPVEINAVEAMLARGRPLN